MAVFAAAALAGCSGAVEFGENEGDGQGKSTVDLGPDAPDVLPAGPETACGDGTCSPGETCFGCSQDCGPCGNGCGNGVCSVNEDCQSCAQDCGACPACGDASCDPGESCGTCPADCGPCPGCGNGVCSPTESCSSCAADCGACPCAHDECSTGDALAATCDPCVAQICAVDSYCCNAYWDQICVSEVASVCGQQCPTTCGDGLCDPTESCQSCSQDCGACPTCGDGFCDWGEDCSTCSADCGACAVCGNGTCDAGENCTNCAGDCGACPSCPGNTLGGPLPQTVTGSTAGLVNGLASPCAYSNAPEATYSFTAPADGAYEINTFGSAYDTLIYVLDGTCQGPSLACNDDTAGLQSKVTVTLQAGQTVVVSVDGWASSSGAYTLHVCQGPCAPACDDGTCDANESCSTCPQDCGQCQVCGDGYCSWNETCSTCAQDCGNCPVCGNGTCDQGETCGACAGDCGACVCHDVCSTGTALDPTCGTCEAQICAVDPFCCSGSWDSLCVNQVGSVCGTPCAPSCGDGICQLLESCSTCAQDCGACATCGDGWCNQNETCSSCAADCGNCPVCGNGTCDAGENCSICPGDCGACPACPSVSLASTVPQTVTGSTAGGVNSLSAPCGSSSAPEVTYSFTAPAAGTYQINTFGSAYDTLLYVLDGSCQGSPLACNDDNGGALQSQVTVTLAAGQTVIIVVDGFGGSQGSFTQNIN